MAPVTDIESQLARDEGKRASAYQDSRGFWTIGIGICIDARVGCGLDEEEISYLFDRRRKKAEDALSSAFPWSDALDTARRGVLVNLTYNMGITRLSKFVKFLAAMQVGRWPTAAQELVNSQAHVEEPARIERLAQQVLTGEWQ